MIIGEAGILIRGASGCGKSGLALALLRIGAASGQFARLVGDDRIGLAAAGGRLVAQAHPAIAGQVERRGFGIARMPAETRTVVRLVIDFQARGTKTARLPEPQDEVTQIAGVALPRITLPPQPGLQEASHAILAWLRHEMRTGKADDSA